MLYNQTMARRKRKTEKKRVFGVVNEPNGVASSEKLDLFAIEKEFADILNYQRKQANNLLGIFDGEKYVIPDDIVKELIAIPKKFDRIEENVLYCATILGEFVLNFKVEMEIAPDFCTAKLYMIEIEHDIEEDIKHLTLLSEIVEPYMFEFRREVEKRWNIYYDNEELQKSEFLYRYLHMQSEEFLFNRELVEILSQLYLVRMLALLDKMGELGDKVRFEYKLLMEKYLQKDLSVSQNYTLQKQLLNHILKKYDVFKEIVKTEEGLKILQGYSNPLKNVRDKTYPTVITTANTEIEKKEEKKVSPKATVKKKSSPAKQTSGKAINPWEKYKATKLSGGSPAKTTTRTAQPTQTAQPKPSSQPQTPQGERTGEEQKKNEEKRNEIWTDFFEELKNGEGERESEKEIKHPTNVEVSEENSENAIKDSSTNVELSEKKPENKIKEEIIL